MKREASYIGEMRKEISLVAGHLEVSQVMLDPMTWHELAAIKYPIKPTDCWQRKQRQEYLRKLYIERLRNEQRKT